MTFWAEATYWAKPSLRSSMGYCIFCDYENAIRKEHMVYEDADSIAFLSKKALANGHVLVVPKRHVESITELYDIKAFLLLIERIADAVSHIMDANVINIQITHGEVIKKSQPHSYVHIIPVHQRELGYFEAMPNLAIEEMDTIAEKIRKELV